MDEETMWRFERGGEVHFASGSTPDEAFDWLVAAWQCDTTGRIEDWAVTREPREDTDEADRVRCPHCGEPFLGEDWWDGPDLDHCDNDLMRCMECDAECAVTGERIYRVTVKEIVERDAPDGEAPHD